MDSKRKFTIFLVILIFSFVFALVSGYFGFNESALVSFVSTNHNLAAAIYSILFIILGSLSFSMSVMIGAGTLFFSSLEVITYATIGILGSAMIDFHLSRFLGSDYLRDYIKKRGGKIEKLDQILEKDPFKTVLILSMIFFVPPTIPNYLGGIMKINRKKFFIATFLGNILNTIFIVLLIIGFLYSNTLYIYISIISLILITSIALLLIKGEIMNVLHLSFPRVFKLKV